MFILLSINFNEICNCNILIFDSNIECLETFIHCIEICLHLSNNSICWLCKSRPNIECITRKNKIRQVCCKCKLKTCCYCSIKSICLPERNLSNDHLWIVRINLTNCFMRNINTSIILCESIEWIESRIIKVFQCIKSSHIYLDRIKDKYISFRTILSKIRNINHKYSFE